MSNRHTSGRSSRARATASRPSAASPTTSMPGWASRIIVQPGADDLLVVGDEHPDGHRARHRPAAARPRPSSPRRVRPGLAGAAEQRRPLGHPEQAVARRWPGRARRVAVVVRPSAARRRRRRRPGRRSRVGVPGMPHGVGDRLLRDPVDRRLDRRAAGRRGRRRGCDLDRGAPPSVRRRASRGRRCPAAGRARRRRRRAARRPWSASRPASATPPPRSPRSASTRRVRVGGRDDAAGLGAGSRWPTRGGRPCRAARGPAARARGA